MFMSALLKSLKMQNNPYVYQLKNGYVKFWNIHATKKFSHDSEWNTTAWNKNKKGQHFICNEYREGDTEEDSVWDSTHKRLLSCTVETVM